MKSILASFMLATKICIALPNAYMIDNVSCNKAQTTYLRGQIQSAFGLARDAATAAAQTPLHQPVEDTLTYLFNGLESASNMTPPQWMQARFHGFFPYNYRSDLPQFEGVLSIDTEVAPGTNLRLNDVKFYCGIDRYKEMSTQAGKRWIDTDIDQFITNNQDPGNQCREGITLGWTASPGIETTPHLDLTPNGAPTLFNQITFCPWFLNYAMKTLPSCNSLSEVYKTWIARTRGKSIAGKYGYSDIDLYSVMDKTVLHELMHTRADGDLDDLLLDFAGDDSLENTAYGWNNCRRLAQDARSRPPFNPDTFSLFGSAVRILNAGEYAITPGGLLVNHAASAPGPQKLAFNAAANHDAQNSGDVHSGLLTATSEHVIESPSPLAESSLPLRTRPLLTAKGSTLQTKRATLDRDSYHLRGSEA